MNPKVAEFLKLSVGDEWDTLDEAEKTSLVTHFSNPANMEALLYKLDPGFYNVEADPKGAGTVRDIAGKLTGGESIPEVAANIGMQFLAKPVKAAGGYIKQAGEIIGYPMPTLDEYGRAAVDYNKPSFGGKTQEFLGGIAENVSSNLGILGGATVAAPLLGLNPVTAIPALTLGAMAIMSGGEALSNIQAEHPEYSPTKKALYGLGYGAFELAGERAIPVLGKALKQGGIGADTIVKALTQDVLGEMGTAFGQGLLDIGMDTGDTQTPISEKMATAGLASVISTPLIGGGAKLLSSRIGRLQKSYEAKQTVKQDEYIDKMVSEGKASIINPMENEILPTAEQLDETLIRGMETAEINQRKDINDILDIIEENVKLNTPESQQEAETWTNELFQKYDSTYIESEMDKRPILQPKFPKLTEDQRNEALRAQTILEYAQQGDEQANDDFNAFPENIQLAAIMLQEAEAKKQKPGRDIARVIAGEDSGIIDFEASKKVKPVKVQEATGNPEPESRIKNDYQEGDKIYLKGEKLKERKFQSSTLQDVIPNVTIMEKLENGNYKVSIPDLNAKDGIREAIVSPDKIATSAELGIRNIDVKLGPKSPSAYSIMEFTKQMMTGLKGFVNMVSHVKGLDTLGNVTVRKSDGTPISMRLDHALLAPEGVFEKVAAHEIAHVISMINRTTKIPGFEKARPGKGTLLGDLLKEWSSMEQAVRVKPFEFAPGVDSGAIYAQQEKFVDDLYSQYEQQGKDMDAAGRRLMQQNWDRIANEHKNVMLTDAEKADIDKEVSDYVKIHKIKESALKTRYRQQVTNKILASRGALLAGTLREEMEQVSLAFRGLKDTRLNRRTLKSVANAKEEIFADFVASKLLKLVIKDPNTGEMVELAKTYAPNASLIFDNYMERSPSTQEAFRKIYSIRNDADSIAENVSRRMRETEQKYAERKLAESPISIFAQGLTDTKSAIAKAFMDINYPARKAIEKNMGVVYSKEFQNKMEELAAASSILTPFVRKAAAIFNNGIQVIREAKPNLDAELNLGTFSFLKRIAEGGRKGVVEWNALIEDESGETKKARIKQEYDMFSGPITSQAEAQRVLAESSLFGDPKVSAALDKLMKDFHEIWVKDVLNIVEERGIVSKAQAQVLKKNVYYATFAIERELFGKVPFKSVTPTIKEQTGTVHDVRNPLGATIEKGIQLVWNAYLNDSKRSLVEGLPDEYKTKIEKTGSMFQQPVSKSYSLVTYKVDGKDVGYHIPAVFAAGVDFQSGTNHLMNDTLKLIGNTNNYFRQLYTTWQPSFQLRNTGKDLSRSVIRSIGPYWGGGMIPKWFGTLLDLIDPRAETREKLNAEEEELYRKGLILSDYDFRARDALGVSSFENIQRMWLQEFRGENPAQTQQRGYLATILGKYTVGQRINSIIGYMGNAANPLASRMEALSRGLERLPKRAALRYYKENPGNMTEAELRMLIRKSGSPFFLNHGEMHPITSNVMLFFNPGMQDLYENIQLAYEHPSVAAKWLLASSMSLGFNHGLIMTLASMGAMGEEMARAIFGIPEDDMDRNICIPIGVDEKGQTIYFRIPLDETTALIARMTRQTLKGHFVKALSALPQQTLPSWSPLLDTAVKGIQIASGINPQTNQGTPMIPEAEFNADPKYRWKAFAKHVYNTMSPTAILYKFNFESSEDKFAKRIGKSSNAWASVVGEMLDLPFAQTAAKSVFLTRSNKGYAQRYKEQTKSLDETVATFKILAKQYTDAQIAGDMDAAKELLTELTDLTKRGDVQALAVAELFKKLPENLRKTINGGLLSKDQVEFEKLSKFQQIEVLLQSMKNQ